MTDEHLLAALQSMKEDLLGHIHDVGAQLHIQIQEVDGRLAEWFDRIEARMDRQGGLIQGGSRTITRMIEWTEGADTTFSRYDRRLADFERRLDQIERKP
jgi:hypothetical protein